MPSIDKWQDRDPHASIYPSQMKDRCYGSEGTITLVTCGFGLRKINASRVQSREQAGNTRGSEMQKQIDQMTATEMKLSVIKR